MRLKSTLLVLISGLFLLQFGTAFAAKCGGYKQRPCKVWERIPSCNKGLYESFKHKKCLRKKKKKKKKLSCGRLNQRPCKVWERIPSCDKGLYENFKRKKCLRKARKIVKPCGGLNQRACCLSEKIFGACKKGLVKKARKNSGWCKGKVFQSQHICVRSSCGRLNKRPCKVWERIPSCNKGLVENFRLNRCVKPGHDLRIVINKLRGLGGLSARKKREAIRKTKRLIRNLGPYAKFVKTVVNNFKRRKITPRRLRKLHQRRKFNQIARLIGARSLIHQARRLRNPLRGVSAWQDRSYASLGSQYGATPLMANVMSQPSPFKAVTVGAAIDVSAGLNVTHEAGISINHAPKRGKSVWGYISTGLGGGITFGADGSIAVGFYVDEADRIGGETIGVTAAASYYGGMAVTVYFYKDKLKVAGFALAPQGGFSGEVEVNWWRTKVF